MVSKTLTYGPMHPGEVDKHAGYKINELKDQGFNVVSMQIFGPNNDLFLFICAERT